MKTQLFKKIAAASMATLMAGAVLAGCGNNASSGSSSKTHSSSSQASESKASTGTGKVYWLNFKPEIDETLQALAKTYTEKTGVEVKVTTAASGNYIQTLTSEMDKSNPPTLFVIGNKQGVKDWGEFAIDLTDTEIAKKLSTQEFNLTDESGRLVSIPYCYECYGIIVNTDLIKQAGHKMDEIKNFAGLKAVAEDTSALTRSPAPTWTTAPPGDSPATWLTSSTSTRRRKQASPGLSALLPSPVSTWKTTRTCMTSASTTA